MGHPRWFPDECESCRSHLSTTVTEQSCGLGIPKAKIRETKSPKPSDAKFDLCQVLLQTAGLCASMPNRVKTDRPMMVRK